LDLVVEPWLEKAPKALVTQLNGIADLPYEQIERMMTPSQHKEVVQ
jgi:hypothetical protein